MVYLDISKKFTEITELRWDIFDVDVDYSMRTPRMAIILFNAKTMTPKNLYGIYLAMPLKKRT